MTTPNLELPEFGTAGPPDGGELSRGMRRLDAVVQLAVLEFATAPPADPNLGDRVIVEAPATGVFAGRELHVAFYSQDGWVFFVPRDGWLATVGTALWVFDEVATAWVLFDIDFFSPLTTKGDLLAHDGSNVVRLPAGANGMIIYADSSQPAGLRYDVPPSGGGGGGASNVTADTHPATTDAADDEFETGSAIDTAGTRFSGATAWQWENQGTMASAVDRGSLVLTAPVGTTTQHRGVYQTPSGSTWRYRAKVAVADSSNSAYMWVGRGTAFINCGWTVSGTTVLVFVQRLTNNTTVGATPFTGAAASTIGISSAHISSPPLYVEIEYDGTNLILRASATGVDGTFFQVHTEAALTNLGGAPTKLGLAAQSNSASLLSKGVFDWFRKVA